MKGKQWLLCNKTEKTLKMAKSQFVKYGQYLMCANPKLEN